MNDNLGQLLATGNVAEVFECGRSRVVKLYRSAKAKQPVFREAANHAAVEELGLPVPGLQGVLQIAGRWGLVFDRVDRPSFAEQMREDPALIPHYIQTLAQLQALIHGYPAHRLANLKPRLASNIERARLLDGQQRQILLSRLAEMPNGDRLCHGDFHPINVLGQDSDPIIIDWPDATCGDPAADCCRSYLLLKLHADLLLKLHAEEIAEPYLDAYCRINPMPREKILDWLPYVAAARLAENIPGGLDRLREIAHVAP